MSILLDEEQLAIGEAARRLVAGTCDRARLLALLDRVGAYDEAFWQAAVAQGWTALAVPEAHGGQGMGLVELGQVAQAAGAAPAGAPFLAPLAGMTRALCGGAREDRAAEARERWLPRLADGSAHAALALAEGTEMLPARPALRLNGDGLHGFCPGVVAGQVAAIALVWALDEAERPVLALAELAGEKGPQRSAVASYDPSRLQAGLSFAGTPALVLARGEAARVLALEVLSVAAVVMAFEQLGGAEALLWTARDYANSRRAFGQPIGAFQSVKHRIAELWALVEIARANALHAAASDGTAGFIRAAAAARLSATEAYDTAARDCVQIHGGLGVAWETGLHLHMRRARSLAGECGNSLFWEDVLVEDLIRGEQA